MISLILVLYDVRTHLMLGLWINEWTNDKRKETWEEFTCYEISDWGERILREQCSGAPKINDFVERSRHLSSLKSKKMGQGSKYHFGLGETRKRKRRWLYFFRQEINKTRWYPAIGRESCKRYLLSSNWIVSLEAVLRHCQSREQ